MIAISGNSGYVTTHGYIC